MPRKRTYLRTNQFQPDAADAEAIAELSDARLCRIGLNPQGRVYGAAGAFTDSHVPALLKLPHLIEVTVSNLHNCQVFTDDGFAKLIDKSSVQIFGCAQNTALTNRSAEVISNSNTLRWVGLNGCSITDNGVRSISNRIDILGLYLADTPITMKCVPDLCRLTGLRSLNLRGTPVTETSRDILSKHLTKCRTLRLTPVPTTD